MKTFFFSFCLFLSLWFLCFFLSFFLSCSLLDGWMVGWLGGCLLKIGRFSAGALRFTNREILH